MKDEEPIGKKMKEAILAKGKPIVLENVRLYVQSMAKGDLEAKRVEPKSNQSNHQSPYVVREGSHTIENRKSPQLWWRRR